MKPFITALSLIAALIGTFTPTAHACGHCHGDDIASVYDGDIVAKAFKSGKCIAYIGIEGSYGKSLSERLTVIAAVSRVKGVEKGSAVAAESNPAVRAVYDPRKTNATKIVLATTLSLEKEGWRTTLLKQECPEPKQ